MRNPDARLLAALEHRDRTDAGPSRAPDQCHGCRGNDWWTSKITGDPICRTCHPPTPGAER